MYNIVYSELLKLKKSYINIFIVIGALFMPLVMMTSKLMNEMRITSILDLEDYFANIDLMQMQFMYTIIFAIIAGFIYSRECSDKTIEMFFTYPFSRIKLFIGKFITLYIIIFIIYSINFIVTIGSLYFISDIHAPGEIIQLQLKCYIYSFLMQIVIMPVAIYAGILSKNIIFPALYGVIAAVSCIFSMMSGIYMQFSPFMMPALPTYYYFMVDPVDFIAVILVSSITFIIFMALCLHNYEKSDIR